MTRRAARVDGNHKAIAGCFAAAGCSVQSLATVGNGCPDLLVGIAGWNVLVEVKDSAQRPSARRLTADQKRWHARWRGSVHILETVEGALLLIDLYRRA